MKKLSASIYQKRAVALAYHYDRLSSNFRLYKHWVEINFLEANQGYLLQPILEVGCGTGRITECLIKRGLNVVALDNSQAMLDEFKRRLGRSQFLTLIKASATRIPAKNREFVTTLAFRVIWHLSNREIKLAIKEMTRVTSHFVVFDATNDEYKKSIIGQIALQFYKSLIHDHKESSLYLNLTQIKTLMANEGFTLRESHNLEGLPHVWLNLWPSEAPKVLFKFARLLDRLFILLVPPQRRILVFERI